MTDKPKIVQMRRAEGARLSDFTGEVGPEAVTNARFNPQVVETLEDMLLLAKQGKLLAFAAAFVGPRDDEKHFTSGGRLWAGLADESIDSIHMVGMTRMLLRRLEEIAEYDLVDPDADES